MNKINYDGVMQDVIANLSDKPKLLLHTCCAPCSTACIERLKDHFDITAYFYNPNMDTRDEYELRASELARFCEKIGVNYVLEDYNKTEFLNTVKGKELEPEGGARCFICYRLRLAKTKDYAEKNGYEYFATALTVSPLKNTAVLNQTGFDLADGGKVKYLPSDFKKKNGYLRSIELSNEYGLYRQNYCGCEFSKNKV